MHRCMPDHNVMNMHGNMIAQKKKIKVSLWIPKITQSNILHKENLK